MPTIQFKKNKPTITVPSGANLMKSLIEHGVSVASSCAGDAVCGKCWVYVVEGAENLSLSTDDEVHLKAIKDLPRNCRVSCQAEVLGDIIIDTPYW